MSEYRLTKLYEKSGGRDKVLNCKIFLEKKKKQEKNYRKTKEIKTYSKIIDENDELSMIRRKLRNSYNEIEKKKRNRSICIIEKTRTIGNNIDMFGKDFRKFKKNKDTLRKNKKEQKNDMSKNSKNKMVFLNTSVSFFIEKKHKEEEEEFKEEEEEEELIKEEDFKEEKDEIELNDIELNIVKYNKKKIIFETALHKNLYNSMKQNVNQLNKSKRLALNPNVEVLKKSNTLEKVIRDETTDKWWDKL